MAQQTIDVGTAYDDPSADKQRDANVKINANFDEIYGAILKFPLGGWDAETDAELEVPLSVGGDLFDITNCSFKVMILDDAGELLRDFNIGGIATLSNFSLTLQRTESGIFDSTSYNDDQVNRGYLYITQCINAEIS